MLCSSTCGWAGRGVGWNVAARIRVCSYLSPFLLLFFPFGTFKCLLLDDSFSSLFFLVCFFSSTFFFSFFMEREWEGHRSKLCLGLVFRNVNKRRGE